LLQALGRTVADHVHEGYASLETDERFWTLIHLLQSLARPNVRPRVSPQDCPSAPASEVTIALESLPRADFAELGGHPVSPAPCETKS